MKKRIALVQTAPVLGQPETNFARVLSRMEAALRDNPDVLVLPETFNVGFFPRENLAELADADGRRTKALLGGFARQHRVNVVGGSVVTLKAGNVYNTSYVFDREGACICEYDKIHGFSPSGEQDFFRGGEKTVLFKLDDELTCSVVICYDIRFAELVRTVALQGAELLFVPAEWPLARRSHWEILNRARAIENQFFVCAVNGSGYAGEMKFGGNSLLVDPWGDELLHLGTEEETGVGEIDLSVIADIRRSINVFRDRRPEMYRL